MIPRIDPSPDSKGCDPGRTDLSRHLESSPDLESTADLLQRVRKGEVAAQNRLVSRYLPILTGLAHGRLPLKARSLIDTGDVVLITLQKALQHVDTFEPRHEGAFMAYLRQALFNQIRDEVRRAGRRPAGVELTDDLAGSGPSPLEELIGREAMDRYQDALDALPEAQREAVMLRLELGMSYVDIARALGSESPNAVRMAVSRALARMAERMKEPTS